MHMRIPETGKHNAAFAGNRLDALGDAQMLPDPRDHSMTAQPSRPSAPVRLARSRQWRA